MQPFIALAIICSPELYTGSESAEQKERELSEELCRIQHEVAFNAARWERLQKEKRELEECFEKELRELQVQQESELATLEEKLRLRHASDRDHLRAEHQSEVEELHTQHQEQCRSERGMARVSLIEPAVGLYAFAMFMFYPLLQQYVYRRLWFELSGFIYTSESLSHCSSNHSYITLHQAVQKETSLFLLHSELCFLIPSLISALLLVSYSDYCGRKVAIVPPLVGEALHALSYVLVSRFSFSLNYLLASSFMSGLMGGPPTLIGGCFAYVADLCGEDLEGQKTVRMARLDMILGVLTGLASLCTGFFIKAAGFTWPFLTAVFLHLINLLYVLVVLKESLVLPNSAVSTSSPSASEALRLRQTQALTTRLQGVYLLFAASNRRRNVVLLLMLAAFAFFKLALQGGWSIFILYELNTPLCWSEVFVGYGSALSTAIYLVSFAGVALLSRCLPDAYIILLGLMSVAAGLIMAAFAKTTLLMFLVRLPLLLSIMPTPVLRSMMSKIVSGSEQGAMFACIAFVEMLSVGVSFTVFNSIYAATLSWFSGFSFLLAAGLTVIPSALICVIICLRLDVYEESIKLTESMENHTEILEIPQ